MRASLPLAVVFTLAVTLLTPASPAVAAPACHGRRATVVGSGHGVLDGTRHSDVIVTNGATLVNAEEGDDLICVIGAARQVSVEAGDGDDQVFVQAKGSSVDYRSGRGSDSYQGNGQFDSVSLRADGTDLVDTAGGGDIVTINAAPGRRRARVLLGSGDDTLFLESSSVTPEINGGSGTDRMYVNHSSKHRWSFDNRHGVATAGQHVRYRWHSFEHFDLSGLRAPAIEFHGSDRPETFYVQDTDPSPREIAVAMAGGDDDVTVFARQHGSIDGGPGRDLATFGVNLISDQNSVVADLASGSATVRNATLTSSWALGGLEDVTAVGWPRAELRGDDGANVLRTTSTCFAVLDGRGGSDTLDGSLSSCDLGAAPHSPVTTAVGGDGDDVMLGGFYDDSLDGGNGNDSANGGGGTDTCVAEARTACELP